MSTNATSPRRRIAAVAVSSLLAAACDASPGANSMAPAPAAPAIESFVSAPDAVFVGEPATLTAVFSGDSAAIKGIGPVQSGVPVASPALARATTFTLVVRSGSQEVEARLTVPAVYRDRFRALAPSPIARTQHVAMALAGGGALAMGGNASDSPNVPDADSTDRFDPVGETVSPGPTLAFSAMATFTATAQLPGGGLLLIGGGVNSGTELGGVDGIRATQAFDPAAGTFSRVGATATLDDGRVLVAGGEVPSTTAAERYDPSSGTWSSAGDMGTRRRGHTATTLGDGRVLLAGGVSCCDAAGETLTGTAEIFDPARGEFTPTGSLGTARAFHSATLLTDGRVLVTGGLVDLSASTTASAEIYDPSTGLFGPAGEMQIARLAHAAVLLSDGRVLVLGGVSASPLTDLYDPGSDRWSPGPPLQPAWAWSTATLLDSGKVLVLGGEDAQGFPVATAMLFE